jgi:hypothetical protein
MTDSPTTPLSDELAEMIRTQYPPEAQTEVCATLLEYGVSSWHYEIDRVRFDVLYVSAGDFARVRLLIDLAKQDCRDVMNHEYFWRAGRIYPHPWARRHAGNRDQPEAPPLDPAVIAIARVNLIRRSQVGGPESTASARAARWPRSLLLSFSSGEKLAHLAARILTLGDGEDLLDLSPVLEYRFDRNAPSRTVVRWLGGEDIETLTYDDGTLSWNGSGRFWSACSRRLTELADTKVASHLSIFRDTADQQVLIGYRPPGAGAPDYRRWY